MRYRVRTGSTLAHGGRVCVAGEILELPRAIAEDMAVAGDVEAVDDQGRPIALPPADDLERFRAHERVSILRGRLVDAQQVVSAIQAQLQAEELSLAEAVKAQASQRSTAAGAPASGPTPVAPTAASGKEK